MVRAQARVRRSDAPADPTRVHADRHESGEGRAAARGDGPIAVPARSEVGGQARGEQAIRDRLDRPTTRTAMCAGRIRALWSSIRQGVDAVGSQTFQPASVCCRSKVRAERFAGSASV